MAFRAGHATHWRGFRFPYIQLSRNSLKNKIFSPWYLELPALSKNGVSMGMMTNTGKILQWPHGHCVTTTEASAEPRVWNILLWERQQWPTSTSNALPQCQQQRLLRTAVPTVSISSSWERRNERGFGQVKITTFSVKRKQSNSNQYSWETIDPGTSRTKQHKSPFPRLSTALPLWGCAQTLWTYWTHGHNPR